MGRSRVKAGIALLTLLLALSAAPAASATAFTSSAYPATLTGLQGAKGVGDHRFTFSKGRTVYCEEASLAGTLNSPQSWIQLEPTYKSCKTDWGEIPAQTPATVATNGCSYRFSVTEGKPQSGTSELVCPTNKMIEVRVYNDAEKHKLNQPTCTIGVVPQTLGSVTYENEKTSPQRLRITSSSAIFYGRLGGESFWCGAESGWGTFTGQTFVTATSGGSAVPFVIF
jgi:hypothetical protein